MKALGLVETMGLVPALEAADTAAKSADVSLAGLQFSGAGLVTVKLFGDISSVQAGVDAARTAAGRLGRVKSWTVIGRTGEGVPLLVAPDAGPGGGPGAAGGPDTGEPEPPGPRPAAPGPLDRPDLEAMRVVKLRQLARSLSARADAPFPLTPKEIKYGKKEELISVISRFLHRQKAAQGDQDHGNGII